MRTLEEVKKEQDQALLELGFHVVRVEQLKGKVFMLAAEAEKLQKDETTPNPLELAHEP